MRNNDHDRRVLVMAPVGQDARAMAELLASHGLAAWICHNAAECWAELNAGAGALLLTEEALVAEQGFDVLEPLKQQPQWSELPVIILTTGGEPRLRRLLELAAKAAGTVTLLERPISTITLLRSVEVALNSRRRQFQVRDLLEEQRLAQRELSQAHDQLADRARQLEALVQERTAKLADSNEQLRREMREREQLQRQLNHAQEEERRRIARELHDQMGQELTALNLGLNSLHKAAPKKLKDAVRSLQELATQTARNLRRVALELRPSTLDELGLVKAVRNLAETWSAHCGIQVDVESRQYPATGVSAEVETTLYRVIQEALNNVAKHSGAKYASIILHHASGHVELLIEDDGSGFDATKPRPAPNERGGLGLRGIQERLSLLGGTLNVESAPQQGTTIVVRIPVPEKK